MALLRPVAQTDFLFTTPLLHPTLPTPQGSVAFTSPDVYAFTPEQNPLALTAKPSEWQNVRWFAQPTLSPVPAPTSLDEALAAIDAEQIKKDVYWIADDARGGRDTPSTGQTQTAEYIRDRLQQYGWQGAGDANGGYFYHYKSWGGGFFKTWEDVISETAGKDAPDSTGLGSRPDQLSKATGLVLSGGDSINTLSYGTDYFYSSLTQLSDAKISGEVVFLGEATETDFTSTDVKNKWIIVYDDPNVAPEERRDWAHKQGAKGLLVLPHPTAVNPYLEGRLHKLKDMAESGNLQYATHCSLDEIMFTREGAERLWKILSSRNNAPDSKGLVSSRGKSTPLTLTDNRVLKSPFAALEADNVVGFWKGSDPELAKEVIIISAHYDHVGKRGSTVYNGADDNGSGTSGLLALAAGIAKLNPKRSVMLMWVSGEEKGLLGSQAWVEKPYLPAGTKAVANINIDMIGRNDDPVLDVTPTSSHKKYNDLTRMAERLSPEEGFPKLGSADWVYTRSDHYMFSKLGIPIIFFTSGMHEDYHKPSDDPEKINYGKIARVTRLILRMLDQM